MRPIDAAPHRRFVWRPRAVRALLRELWPCWLLLGVVAGALALALAGPSPDRVRALGLLLQLLGLTMLTVEVMRTWRRRRSPSPGDWIRRISSAIRPDDAARDPVPADRAAGRGATPAPLAKVPPGASGEQRLRALEKNVEELRRDIVRGLRAQEKALGDVRQTLARDAQARAAALSTARRALDDDDRGIPLELVGLGWLWSGTVALLAADRIAAALRWIAG